MKKLLLFMLDGKYFALDIFDVKRVLPYKKPSMLIEAKKDIDGVIEFEDKIVPLINLRQRLKLFDDCVESDLKIILTNTDTMVGLIVDDVVSVIDCNENDIEKNGYINEFVCERGYVMGVLRVNNEILTILKIDILI